MDTFFNIILDLLAIVGIIVFGSFVIVLVADLILCLFDDHDGIIFRRGKGEDSSSSVVVNNNTVEKKDDIVVYNNQTNPNVAIEEVSTTQETQSQFFDGDRVQSVDFDKALEEQNKLNASFAPTPEPAPKKVEPAPNNNDGIFWDDDNDDEFNSILDEVISDAKKYDEQKEEENKKEVVEEETKKSIIDEATQKELEELRALKEQQQKEIEEFRQMKEDFAREKEEQLAMLKENLENAKADEIEKIKQEAIQEQVKLEEMQLELEEGAAEEKEVAPNVQPIVKETIIKDEEELNKLKYKNLIRMNSRLTRIIRDTEKLQRQKQEEQYKLAEEKRKLQEKEIQDRQREQARITNIQLKNQEMLIRQQEQLRKKDALSRLNNTANRVSKYKLDSKKVVKVSGEEPKEHKVVEEVVTTVETIPVENRTEIETIDKAPMKSTAKPLFDKEYYELKLAELDEELRDAERELRINKSEYLPLTRIYKAYDRDSEKLRKKELQVAKQKVAIYGHGVNSAKVDPAKKQKLEENLQLLAELKDSVEHCEEVIKKNKDRYPILEKNNKLINKQIERIYEDIKVCEKAIAYYKKNVD